MDLLDVWKNQVHETSAVIVSQQSAGRKFVENYTFTVEGKTWAKGLPLNYTDMGYGGGGGKATKEKQLRRNYFNEEEISKINQHMVKRIKGGKKNSSLSAPMKNKEKDEDRQGFCMQAVTLSHYKFGKNEEYIQINFYYRMTEIVCKFLADLKFLHEVVVPALTKGIKCELRSVTFHFSNIYVSNVYWPIAIKYLGPEIMDGIEDSNPSFHRALCYTMKRMYGPNPYKYRSRAVMYDYFHKALAESQRRVLKQHLKRRKYL